MERLTDEELSEIESVDDTAFLSMDRVKEIITDLRHYKQQAEEYRNALEQIKGKLEDPIPGTMIECHKISRQALGKEQNP